MSEPSKTKQRLHDCIAANKKLRFEFTGYARALAAILRMQGTIKIPYISACEVEDTDRVRVSMDKKSGEYTVELVGEENAEPMGSRSHQVGVQEREGYVDGPLPEALSKRVDEEVRESDQHDKGEAGSEPDSEQG